MGKFNWIMLSLAVALGAAALLSMALFLALDIKVWLTRARRLRHATYLVLLLWFNVEVWGRVVWTLVHWSS